MDLEREMMEAEEIIAVMESLPNAIINTDEETVVIQQVVQSLQSLVDVCLVQQKQIDACLQGLREKVKAQEQRILDAQKGNLKDEDVEALRNNLAEARVEEEKARATARSMEEHLDGLAEQLQSVEAQKQTLASLASQETRLKNEMSLFSTVSGIIPNMAKKDVFAGSIQPLFLKFLVMDEINQIYQILESLDLFTFHLHFRAYLYFLFFLALPKFYSNVRNNHPACLLVCFPFLLFYCTYLKSEFALTKNQPYWTGRISRSSLWIAQKCPHIS
ncbi:hypothetical protein M758_4G056200 [Ceratodon purpureus]|nr:hypothetical protein M758_4G056200 [Ceratodon purpureus]